MNDDGTTSPFFTVPLTILAYRDNEEARLDAFVQVAIVRYAHILMKSDNSLHEVDALNQACEALRVTLGDRDKALRTHREFCVWSDAVTRPYGTPPLIAIWTDLFWDAKSNGRLTYRQFSMLCAIFSVIGMKTLPVRITRKTVLCRQLGYHRHEMMKGLVKRRDDKVKPLTERQVRYTLDELEARSLITRCDTPGRRHVYFKKGKVPRADMQAAVIDILAKHKSALPLIRAADRNAIALGLKERFTPKQ